ncbi:hypothetical protein [Piscinibacter defluvii]|uniref:hypothetical protein n=1 Tax=Piscinibacter defluvii TaxID=1796922 RepID=UPI000FDDF5C1|nr:hypothetical protein [Piscinibacter defluvii]
MNGTEEDRPGRAQTPSAAKVDTVGWGVFLMWVGTALLADVGWPVFFVGTGLIMLGGQAARRRLGLRPDWFALVLGTCFVAAGGWRALDVPLGQLAVPAWLVPSAFIAAGAAIVLSAWRGRGPRP